MQKWPRLFTLVESYSRGESVKKAQVFTKDELLKFLQEAGTKNRYYLVRKVVATIAYLGGTRMEELRSLTFDSIKPIPEGYEVEFKVAKQRLHTKNSR